MKRLYKHITQLPLLSLLIVISIGFSQLHELTHAAESSFHLQTHSPDGKDSSSKHEEDCLVCTLTITASVTVNLSVSPDHSLKEKLTLPGSFNTTISAIQYVRLRAPPLA